MKPVFMIMIAGLAAIGLSTSVMAHNPGGHNGHSKHHSNHHSNHHRNPHYRAPVHGHHNRYVRPRPAYANVYPVRRYSEPNRRDYGHPVHGQYGANTTLRLDNVVWLSLQAGH
jgi:hypothetical protein